MSSPERPMKRAGLREAVARLFGGADDPEGGLGEIIEGAARSLEVTLDRWALGDVVRRFLGQVQQDVLTRAGDWTPLEAILRVGGAVGVEARFRLNGTPVATTTVDHRGGARAMVRAPDVGVYRVDVTLGREPWPALAMGDGVVQVVGARPVVLVDGALALRGETAAFAALVRRLQQAELEVAYFDVSGRDRRVAIRERLALAGLPLAAVLTYEIDAAQLAQLGVGVGRALAATAVRRQHAQGVAVLAIVTDRTDVTEALVDGVRVLRAAQVGRAAEAFATMHLAARRLLAARDAADPVAWRLDCVSGARAVAGNEAVVEIDNRRARERVFALIDAAQRTIDVQFYLVRGSAFTEALLARLIKRGQAGVVVRFMADALFSEQGAYEALSESGPNLQVLTLRPIERATDVDIAHLRQRDHRKLLVVDGERAIVSGRNAGDEYYVGFDEVSIDDLTPHARIPWLDAHIELQGPIVADVQRCFSSTWAAHGGRPSMASDPAPGLAVPGGVRARLVVHEGLADVHGMATYEALLDEATDHVIIVNDFPIMSTLERAILRALARGIRVELLTGSATARRADGSFFPAPIHRTLFEHMVKARLEPLLLAGALVYEYTSAASPLVVARGGKVRPYVHAKVMSVDGRVCTVGSANLDAAASYWESEAIVVIEDAATAAAFEAELRALIERSYLVDPHSEYWLRERLERALVGKLWPDWFYS